MGWIKERAEQIKQQEQDRESERKWEILKSDRLLANRIELWKSLLAQVRADVQELNQEFSADKRKQVDFIEIPSSSFTLRKSHFPAVTMSVHISPDGRRIDFKSQERLSLDAPVHESEGYLTPDLDPVEGFLLKHGDKQLSSYAEASQIFLHPIFEACEMS